MADALKWFNVALAVLGSLAAFGALNKMQFGRTRPCVAAAAGLLAVGLAGQWLGEVRGDWARVADTATFAGILVMLLATQKVPTWFLERWANPAASLVALVAGAVVIVYLLMQPAHAQTHDERGPGVQMDCRQLAELVQASASYRDTGADLKRFLVWMERAAAQVPEARRAVLRREITRMWKERRPAEDAAFAVFQRCQAQLGDMGREG